jgi:ankyrin repeat protein
MRAAIRNDVKQMQLLIEQGTNLTESDSSGWTALMYAAASGHSEPVQMLLRAGADPNQASPRGDTALMASAFRRAIDEDLVRAGANINAQNRDGVTVLMILAGQGEIDEVDAALKAGADPSLKDTQHQSALDYLRAADCGKSQIRDKVLTWMSSEGCGQFDEDEFRKGVQLLTPARHP